MRFPARAWPGYLLLAWSVMAVLFGVTVLAYWPGLKGDFIFDDLPNLVQNESWKISSFTAAAIQQALESDMSGALGRPLAMLSFAANHVWTGQDPFTLKLTNLVMHMVNGLLVFLLCRQLFPLATRGVLSHQRADLACALVAGAWLLHPLQVSTVLYTVQRMEIGATTGVLACLTAYLVARRRQAKGSPGLGWYGLAGLAFLFGLGFKESALLALPLLFLFEALVLRFRDGKGQRSKHVVVFHALWIVPALLVYGLVVVPNAWQASEYAHRDFGLVQRLLSQGPVLAMYLGQVLLPLPDDMLFYYDHIQAPQGLFSPPWTAISLAGLLALAALALTMRNRCPLVSLGILWFFACHSLTSNVIPLELAFEHRNYLALLGPALVTCEIVSRLTRRLHGDAALTVGLAPLLTLAGLCLIQASTWGDPFRLATALAGRNPESPRANYALGTRLHEAAQGDTESPQWSLALRQFEIAAALPGSSALPDQALVIMNSTDDAGFSAARWQALEAKLLDPAFGADDLSALHSVVACRLEERCNIPDAAVIGLLQRIQERHPDVHALTIIRANFTWNGLGDQDAAIAMLRDRRARGKAPYQVDLALAEFLLASKLHQNSKEAATLLAELSGRDLPPEPRARVQTLQAGLERFPREPEPQ